MVIYLPLEAKEQGAGKLQVIQEAKSPWNTALCAVIVEPPPFVSPSTHRDDEQNHQKNLRRLPKNDR